TFGRNLIVLISAACCLGVPAFAGESDCNGNGVPDATDIRDGTSVDCQPDGVPDECQVAEGVLYAYDVGPDLQIGGGGTSVVLGERFFLAASFPFIGGVEYEGIDVPSGTLIAAAVWSDPDSDGDPADAVLLTTAESAASPSGSGRIAFESGVEVGGDGTSFFVGIWFENAPGWRGG
ncbi:MAG: hypothetical protein GY885_18450, partial [Phycisphaeraceae bacterium]|nr:hypothetical protein [Phycisphaeraceae bacterium]